MPEETEPSPLELGAQALYELENPTGRWPDDLYEYQRNQYRKRAEAVLNAAARAAGR